MFLLAAVLYCALQYSTAQLIIHDVMLLLADKSVITAKQFPLQQWQYSSSDRVTAPAAAATVAAHLKYILILRFPRPAR